MRALLLACCLAAAARAEDLAVLVWRAAEAPAAEFHAARAALAAHPQGKPAVVAALLARGPDYAARRAPSAHEQDAARLKAYALTLPWRPGAVQRFDCGRHPEYWYATTRPPGAKIPVYVDLGLGRPAPPGFATVVPNWTLMQAFESLGRPMSMTAGAGFQSFLLTIIADLARRFPVDRDRLFVGGYSRGGNAVWFLGTHRPDLWAGIVPVSGYFQCDPALHDNLRGVAVFAAHGADRGHRAANKFTRALARKLKARPGHDVALLSNKARGVDPPFAARAAAWMARPRRTALPRRVRYVAAGPQHTRAYWVAIEEASGTGGLRDLSILGVGGTVRERVKLYRRPPAVDVAIVAPNEVQIRGQRVAAVRLFLSPRLFDLHRPLVVRVGGRRRTFALEPSLATLLKQYRRDRDGRRLFLAEIAVPLNG